MKFNLYAAIVFSLAFVAVGSAQAPASSAQGSTEYTQPQIKKLARTAHTQEQYSTLAAYTGSNRRTLHNRQLTKSRSGSVAARSPRLSTPSIQGL